MQSIFIAFKFVVLLLQIYKRLYVPSGELIRPDELVFDIFPASDPANGPALSLGGSNKVSNTVADVMGVRYELRAAENNNNKMCQTSSDCDFK